MAVKLPALLRQTNQHTDRSTCLQNPISGGRISALRRSPPDGFSVTSRMEPVLVSLFIGWKCLSQLCVSPAAISDQWRERREPVPSWRHGKSIRRTPPEAGYPPSGERVLAPGAFMIAFKWFDSPPLIFHSLHRRLRCKPRPRDR